MEAVIAGGIDLQRRSLEAAFDQRENGFPLISHVRHTATLPLIRGCLWPLTGGAPSEAGPTARPTRNGTTSEATRLPADISTHD